MVRRARIAWQLWFICLLKAKCLPENDNWKVFAVAGVRGDGLSILYKDGSSKWVSNPNGKEQGMSSWKELFGIFHRQWSEILCV